MRERKVQKRISQSYLGDWDDLRFFLAVGRTGSFTRAAALLRTTQTTIGRRLHAMEERTGAKLFDRRFDGMYLTPAGQEILSHVESIDQLTAQVERLLAGVDQDQEGVVKVAATEGIGSFWLTPRLIDFQHRHPKVVVEVLTGNEVLDLAARQADIAIRLARPTDPKLVGINVGLMRFGLYCSPQYIAQHGHPRSLEEVSREHRVIDHSQYLTLPLWRDFLERGPAVVFRTNSSVAFMHAVGDGRGIGLLPLFARYTAPNLIRLDVPVDCDLPIWLISHSETNRNARTRAMWDYIKDLFRRDRTDWFS